MTLYFFLLLSVLIGPCSCIIGALQRLEHAQTCHGDVACDIGCCAGPQFHQSCLRARAESGELEPTTTDRLAEAAESDGDADIAEGGGLAPAADPAAAEACAEEPDLARSAPALCGLPEAAAAAEGCGCCRDSPAAGQQQSSAASESGCAPPCICTLGSCACAELRQGEASAADVLVEGAAAAAPKAVRICAPGTAVLGVAARQETCESEPRPADRGSLAAEADAAEGARSCKEPGAAALDGIAPPTSATRALPPADAMQAAAPQASAEEAAACARAAGVSAFQAAAQPAGEDATSLISRRSLSRASMSMVLCDDFAMSFCGEDEEEEEDNAERGPDRPGRPAAAKKLRGSDGVASSAALASQFSMFSNELGGAQAPRPLLPGCCMPAYVKSGEVWYWRAVCCMHMGARRLRRLLAKPLACCM